MEIPPENGGMGAEGLRGALFSAPLSDPGLPTHLAAVHEDAIMDAEDGDDFILEKMHALLTNTRTQLAQAVEEANQLQALSSDEEGADNNPSGTVRVEEPDAEALAKMSTKEREAAIKRARNREAARRSRQRKNERINQLYRDIKTLQQENVVLLKCIEDFTKKAINSKEQQLQMKEQLATLATTSNTGVVDTTASLLAHYEDDSMLLPMDVEDMPPSAAAAAGAVGAGPSTTSLPSTSAPHRVPLVSGLSLPSLAELQKLQSGEAAGGQLTARGGGGGTLSARGAAVAEHIAMLSKENSPRDDEIDPGTGGTTAAAGTGTNTTIAAGREPSLAAAANEKPTVVAVAGTAAPSVAAPQPPQSAAGADGGTVDVNMLFGAWNGSDRK